MTRLFTHKTFNNFVKILFSNTSFLLRIFVISSCQRLELPIDVWCQKHQMISLAFLLKWVLKNCIKKLKKNEQVVKGLEHCPLRTGISFSSSSFVWFFGPYRGKGILRRKRLNHQKDTALFFVVSLRRLMHHHPREEREERRFRFPGLFFPLYLFQSLPSRDSWLSLPYSSLFGHFDERTKRSLESKKKMKREQEEARRSLTCNAWQE